jgi:TPR repeat protein/tRNA A-37 threonylcarbamoyl transferase component Bud32
MRTDEFISWREKLIQRSKCGSLILRKTCSKCGGEYPEETTLCPADGFPLIMGTPLSAKELRIGSRYVVESEIARGGMGAIYKARHIAMDRTVAIKLLLADLSTDSDAMMRFQVEARAASILSHPNIIKIFEFDFTDHGMPYLVMEYLEGMSLQSLLQMHQRIVYQNALPMFISMCSALVHAHKRNVIHRDLKPSNIMLVDDDAAKPYPVLVDFGIAKLFTAQGKTAMRLTQTGEVFGSPLYMSPEQCMGRVIDSRSDMYSFGCVMYESLTGIPPIQGKNFLGLVHAHLHDLPFPFSEVAPNVSIPAALEKIVLKTLQKSPDDRYESMNELQADLVALLGELGQANRHGNMQGNKSTSAGVNAPVSPAVVPSAQEEAGTKQENAHLDELHDRAEAGDPAAQHDLGWFYYEGQMYEQDYKQAFHWFSKAAAQQYTESILWLGTLYRNGEGVEKDYAKAMKCFRKGADLGHAASQSYLGDMYEFGVGVDIDYDQAFLWHKKAAGRGHVISMGALGGLYENGLGTEKDLKQAARWYLMAAEKGHADSQNKIGRFYANGTGVTQNKEEAATWYMCAAQQGNDEAKVNLGHCYADGEGVPVDEEEAYRWMKYAGEAGDTEAQNFIAYWHELGMMGLSQDYPTAFRWYTKSALKKNSWAQYKLGFLSEFGYGVYKNEKQAHWWYQLAAGQGLKEAQYSLALCYRDGLGTTKDREQYLEWILKAAEQDYTLAMIELAEHYERVDSNPQTAARWYQKAADLGAQDAKAKLIELGLASTMGTTTGGN